MIADTDRRGPPGPTRPEDADRVRGRGSADDVRGAIRIVVVDDDARLRKELTLLLEDSGYDVVAEAATGTQGVALARHSRPDVIISDLRMPGDVSGMDLAAELQGEVPVIILSAYDDPGLQARVREAGATFLVKGCRSGKIFAAVEQAAMSGASIPA